MKSKSNSEETSVARFPLKMQNEATGFAEHRCRTMRNQESNRSEVAMSGLAVGPDEMGGLMKLTAIARKRVRIISGMILALSLVPIAHGEQDVVTAVHASIQRVDSAAKTIVAKSDDGISHTFHFLDSTVVHGGDAVDVASKDSWHGLREGGEVVVHYTKRGTEDTAVEIDKIGDGGLKATEGTVKEIDRGGKNLVVVAGDGTEETFRLTGRAAKDTGVDIGKGSKVTVFYLGKAGNKVAHFLGTTSSGPS
jgi:hypothetical protein